MAATQLVLCVSRCLRSRQTKILSVRERRTDSVRSRRDCRLENPLLFDVFDPRYDEKSRCGVSHDTVRERFRAVVVVAKKNCVFGTHGPVLQQSVFLASYRFNGKIVVIGFFHWHHKRTVGVRRE